MPRIQAINIEQLEAGSVVEIDGRRYMRMLDHPHLHMEGWVVDLETGWSGHWSRLTLGEAMVVVEAKAAAPARASATYQGHHADGSSIQKHSAGGAYPYVLVLRDSQRPGAKFDWGVIGPKINGIKWLPSSQAWDTYVDMRKRFRAMAEDDVEMD